MPNSNDLAPHGPLSGITVIDLSRILAGPYCTLMLKELGARVIKVESPGIGDDAREYGPFVNGKSAYFQSVNRGKESIVLNLKDEDDKNILQQSFQSPLKEAREHFEKEYLTTQLKKHHGNISKTADFIGMERSALHRKLKSLGIKGIN